MVAPHIGSLLVIDSGEIAGIVIERDFLRRVAGDEGSNNEPSVREIMSSPLMSHASGLGDECMALMTNRRIRRRRSKMRVACSSAGRRAKRRFRFTTREP